MPSTTNNNNNEDDNNTAEDRPESAPNPIVKRRLLLGKKKASAIITELSEPQAQSADGAGVENVPWHATEKTDGAGAGAGGNVTMDVGGRQGCCGQCYAQLKEELKGEIQALAQENRDMFQKQAKEARANNRMLKRLSQFAFERKGTSAAARGDDVDDESNDEEEKKPNNSRVSMNATLSKTPRDLETLWNEYENGIGGRKAAKDFNDAERGRVTGPYSKRNHVWKLIGRLVNKRGVDYKVAIADIYKVYGNISVSKMIQAIQKDAQRGGHPSLK